MTRAPGRGGARRQASSLAMSLGSKPWPWWAAAWVVAGAFVLRALAARGDLWLDEIFTLTAMSSLHSPVEIVTALHHENNHLLYSLLLWILRPFDSEWVYRLPAAAAGAGSVALGAWIAAADGQARAHDKGGAPARAVIAAILLGASYLLVHYGSEARGYSLAVFFSLAALAAAHRSGFRPGSRWAWVYAPALALALLSHALAIHAVAGGLAWSLVRWRRAGLSFGPLALSGLRWHALPVATAVALYVGFLRGVMGAGGNPDPVLSVLGRTVAYASGLPLGLGAGGLLALGLASIAACLLPPLRSQDDSWIFYLTAALASPLAFQLLLPRTVLFERYFVLTATLALVVLARGFAALWTFSGAGKAATVILLAASVAGNVPRIVRLLVEQRGQYSAALARIAEVGPGPVVTVSGDHDFRNGLVVEYYASRVERSNRIVWVPPGTWRGVGPDWFLVHRFESEGPPPPAFVDTADNVYRLDREYLSAPLSGWRWFTFRRADRTAAPP
ncbi:MAG: hypothetical protein HY825_05395 [Acidobacteria bacterium]|nr:hypothetical protein [Acidobacteriota bacterium]